MLNKMLLGLAVSCGLAIPNVSKAALGVVGSVSETPGPNGSTLVRCNTSNTICISLVIGGNFHVYGRTPSGHVYDFGCWVCNTAAGDDGSEDPDLHDASERLSAAGIQALRVPDEEWPE